MRRLNNGVLAALPAHVATPRYDRAQLQGGIVHLGLGAFVRGHMAALTEHFVAQEQDLRWGICGVSLRSPDVRDALTPQDGLYTLALRDAEGESLQIVGCLRECLVAPENPQAVLKRIANPLTRIVSLTVTEKGYCRHPSSGALLLADADIRHDLTNSAAPRTAIGFIVHGMALRKQQGLAPITLMSLDNLPSNGDSLRRLVHEFAQHIDPDLAQWIDAQCSFPNSMVDRIVPRCTAQDRARIATQLGLDDAAPVVAEPFLDWAIEDRFAAGRPDWAAHGARFVAHAAPWEQLKLRMVNGAHSCIAYLAVAAGWPTVDQAMANAALRNYVYALMRDEIEPTLLTMTAGEPTFDMTRYRHQLLQRFANPALAHKTLQIAMDGSQKLPQRLLATARERLAQGQPIRLLALGIAAWLQHLRGHTDAGEQYALEDPLATALQDMRAAALAQPNDDARAQHFTSFAAVFGDLNLNGALSKAIAPWLTALRTEGAASVLDNLRLAVVPPTHPLI